jgi:hypothetical protein
MDNSQITRRMLNTRPEGKGETGRPKLRWKNTVDHDIRFLGERNWKEAKAHAELSSQ